MEEVGLLPRQLFGLDQERLLGGEGWVGAGCAGLGEVLEVAPILSVSGKMFP